MTESQQILLGRMADHSVGSAELTLLHILNYGSCNDVESLPARATGPDYSPFGDRFTLEECRIALQSCLSKQWLQVIDQHEFDRIRSNLESQKYLGPVYGMPDVGNVDYTQAGLELLQRLTNRTGVKSACSSFAYSGVIENRTIQYFKSEKIAVAAISKLRGEEDVMNVEGPFPIGPWRLQWWRKFDTGWQVEIERRRPYSGRWGSETNLPWMFHDERWRKNPQRMLAILEEREMSAADWVVLAEITDRPQNLAKGDFEIFARRQESPYGFPVSAEQCSQAYQRCLARGWIEIKFPTAALPMELLISEVPVLLPFAARHAQDDLSAAVTVKGVAVFRAIAEELSGPAWDDDVWAEVELHRIEHHYCETLEGLASVLQNHASKHVNVQSARIEPIDKWCVYWWKTFSSGFRMELYIDHDSSL